MNQNSRLNFCLLSGFSVLFFCPINKHEPPPPTHLMCPRPVLTCNLRLCLISLHKHWPPPFPPSLLSSFISSLSSIFYGRRNGNVGGVFSLRVSFTEESRGKEARLTQGRSGPTAIRIKINGAQRSRRRSVRSRRGAEVRLQLSWDSARPRSGTRRPADQRENRHRERTWPT